MPLQFVQPVVADIHGVGSHRVQMGLTQNRTEAERLLTRHKGHLLGEPLALSPTLRAQFREVARSWLQLESAPRHVR